MFELTDLWKRESESKYCKNHVKPTIDVSNQKECQDQCVSYSNECIGIAYSYKFGNTHHCYLCLDDNLSYASNDFGFYRRNGMFSNETEYYCILRSFKLQLIKFLKYS